MQITRAMASLMLLLSLAACSDNGQDAATTPAPAIADLATAQKTWAAQNLHDYQYTLSISCFCAYSSGGYVIMVRHDVVESAFTQQDGVYLSADEASRLPTINDLLAAAQKAYDTGASKVEAEYDARGYPTHLYIDQAAGVADDEVDYKASDLM